MNMKTLENKLKNIEKHSKTIEATLIYKKVISKDDIESVTNGKQ